MKLANSQVEQLAALRAIPKGELTDKQKHRLKLLTGLEKRCKDEAAALSKKQVTESDLTSDSES